MRVKKLTLTNFRGYPHAEINFCEGVNVIAGINGAGKSSILDAMRILLSQALRGVTPHRMTRFRANVISVQDIDIRFDISAMDISVDFDIRDQEYAYFVHTSKEAFTPKTAGEVRDQVAETPDRIGFSKQGALWSDEAFLPFALFFSSQRSVLERGLRKDDALSGPNALYHDSLEDRPVRLQAISGWWLTQVALANEDTTGLHQKRIASLQLTFKEFIPEFDAIYPTFEERRSSDQKIATFKIEKGKTILDIRQLSDGERGMLALVLEIGRRLALANPEMANPIRDGEALILIDEIELHLHPKWQMEVIQRLERTFPKCQFIITTHSALVISQVAADRVTILEADGKIRKPLSTYGLPAGEIQESVQKVPPLHQKLLNNLMQALDDFEIEQAEAFLEQLRSETETPNQLVIEMEALIGNTRALMEDAEKETASIEEEAV